MTPEDMRLSTRLGLTELALTGCTTASDHHYIFPNGCRLDDQIEAAKEVGLRLHASRGSMSLGESDGGLPPDSVVEDEEFILEDTQRVIDAYHDPHPGAMTRIVVAPCSPFSVTQDLMRESAALARANGVHLHTHLAETLDEEQFCLEEFGERPLAYAEMLDWAGEDVWFAHAVHINPAEVKRMASGGMGVAHCPGSNMRLASGIAPVRRYLAHDVKVGIGVDGSASNDSSHMLAEARLAMLLSRVGQAVDPSIDDQADLLGARQVLELATLGGARVLGRTDIGSLEEGKCADFIAIRLERIEYAGALHDPVAALVFCSPVEVDYNYVNGRAIVKEGQMRTVELEPLVESHNKAALRLARGE
jgi:cytosine/adenosine deaminase-related metal-dependent hydrolase